MAVVAAAVGVAVIVTAVSMTMSMRMGVTMGLASDGKHNGAQGVHENPRGTDANEPAARDIVCRRDDFRD